MQDRPVFINRHGYGMHLMLSPCLCPRILLQTHHDPSFFTLNPTSRTLGCFFFTPPPDQIPCFAGPGWNGDQEPADRDHCSRSVCTCMMYTEFETKEAQNVKIFQSVAPLWCMIGLELFHVVFVVYMQEHLLYYMRVSSVTPLTGNCTTNCLFYCLSCI